MTDRNFSEIPLTAVGSAGGGCCGGGACACGHGADSATELTASGATAVYEVTGMTCGHCVDSVTEEVGALAGVTGVRVELQAHGISRVRVASEAPLDVDDVRDAIIEAGYHLLEA